MITLSSKQTKQVQAIFKNPEIIAVRKRVTMHGAGDESLALFRTIACTNICEVTTRSVARKPYTKAVQKWINTWRNDGPGGIGEEITLLVNMIESAAKGVWPETTDIYAAKARL